MVENDAAGEARLGEEKAFQGGELARAYVPVQVYTGRLSPLEGWRQGSIFPELIRPYKPAPRRPRRLR
ncbi:MAG: spore coat associated protein CotJA [Bacillota bacterium]